MFVFSVVQFSNSSWPLNRSTEAYSHEFQSEEDLCTTVCVVLKSNSGTFSPVFVNILLYFQANLI